MAGQREMMLDGTVWGKAVANTLAAVTDTPVVHYQNKQENLNQQS